MIDWACVMCGDNLEKAVGRIFNILDLTPDEIVDQEFQKKRDQKILQYRLNRLKEKHPKKTCCRSCGYNFSAWLRNLDSKNSYYRDSFTCFVCRKLKTGGRILKSGSRSVMICRDCHRRRLTNDLRREWEILNHDSRLDYQRRYYSANRKRLNLRKRLWRSGKGSK